jgi:hypothetical protein
MLVYVEFAQGYYTKDGKPNQEFESIRYALRPLKQLYGHKQASQFGPRDLKTLRQQLIDRGLSRTYINNSTNRIKRMFKWAVSEELVPSSVYQALQTVTGLRYGRSEARETEPVTIGFELVAAIDSLVELVRLNGPREECFGHGNWREYFAELGPHLSKEDMAEITRLDSRVKSHCHELALEIPPKREVEVGQDNVAFGYTGLIIHNLAIGFEQPYLPITIRTTEDWKYRMDSLRQIAVVRAGIAGPKWRKDTKSLLFDGRLVKKYKKSAAPNHKTVLEAFESAEWARIIPNPFAEDDNLGDPKRILSETVRSMKSIARIGFSCAGDNEVEWHELPLSKKL